MHLALGILEVVFIVKKELLEYLTGRRNAVKDEFILSREKSGQSELLYVSHAEMKDPLYALWSGPKSKKKRYRQVEGEPQPDAIIKYEEVKPKHTGGKQPYVMLMEGKSKDINDLSMGASGLLLKLFYGGHIEWNTGRIIRKCDKKSMTLPMFVEQFNAGEREMKRAVVELSANGVMTYNRSKRSYFVSRNLAKKGGRQE
jgi:hypothetical protein